MLGASQGAAAAATGSAFGRTFMFLTKLAWSSRVALPMLITAAFLAMDFRMQVEINHHGHHHHGHGHHHHHHHHGGGGGGGGGDDDDDDDDIDLDDDEDGDFEDDDMDELTLSDGLGDEYDDTEMDYDDDEDSDNWDANSWLTIDSDASADEERLQVAGGSGRGGRAATDLFAAAGGGNLYVGFMDTVGV